MFCAPAVYSSPQGYGSSPITASYQQQPIPIFPINSATTTNNKKMSQGKRKSILMKLLKLVGRGNQVRSSKTCMAQIYEERKKQRQRSSITSYLEPMPTIVEEDETC